MLCLSWGLWCATKWQLGHIPGSLSPLMESFLVRAHTRSLGKPAQLHSWHRKTPSLCPVCMKLCWFGKCFYTFVDLGASNPDFCIRRFVNVSNVDSAIFIFYFQSTLINKQCNQKACLTSRLLSVCGKFLGCVSTRTQGCTRRKTSVIFLLRSVKREKNDCQGFRMLKEV